MGRHESLMVLWQYMELSEKKRLMHEFAKTHGDHFSRYEFFEFLADRYDDSQVEFESSVDKPEKEEAA
ncbi:MAG: hypothetical protein ACR2PB_03770 [Desulfocapsaceae bacterium]